MKKIGSVVFVLLVLIIVSACNVIDFEKFTTSATVVKTGSGEGDVITVLLGKISLTDPVYLDNIEDIDSATIPAEVEPVNDAVVKIGEMIVPQTAPGVYNRTDLSLEFKESYRLFITVGDSVELSSEAIVPDSFSIITPYSGDTLSHRGIQLVWHKSDSADFYAVYIDDSRDTAVVVNGYNDIVDDTTLIVPDSCFYDLDGNFVEGWYSVRIIAVNGAWKHGILSFILGGGNVENAWGTYAIVTPANNTLEIYVKSE